MWSWGTSPTFLVTLKNNCCSYILSLAVTFLYFHTFPYHILFGSFLLFPVSKVIWSLLVDTPWREVLSANFSQICRCFSLLSSHPRAYPQFSKMLQCSSFHHLQTSFLVININNHQHQYIPIHNLYQYFFWLIENQLLNSSALFIIIIICHSP